MNCSAPSRSDPNNPLSHSQKKDKINCCTGFGLIAKVSLVGAAAFATYGNMEAIAAFAVKAFTVISGFLNAAATWAIANPLITGPVFVAIIVTAIALQIVLAKREIAKEKAAEFESSLNNQIQTCRALIEETTTSSPEALETFDKTIATWKTEREKNPEFDIKRLIRTLQLSAEKLKGKNKNDSNQTPLILHAMRRGLVLWNEGHVRHADTLVANFLHDTVEEPTKPLPDKSVVIVLAYEPTQDLRFSIKKADETSPMQVDIIKDEPKPEAEAVSKKEVEQENASYRSAFLALLRRPFQLFENSFRRLLPM